jgi:hypothetical protein
MYNPCSMWDIRRPCLRWGASTGTGAHPGVSITPHCTSLSGFTETSTDQETKAGEGGRHPDGWPASSTGVTSNAAIMGFPL